MVARLLVPENPIMTDSVVSVPPLIIADGAYPLRAWLMKPFGGEGDRRRTNFGYHLSRAHNVIEYAFGRLKSCWRWLSTHLPKMTY